MSKQLQFVSTMSGDPTVPGKVIQLSTCTGGYSPLDVEINNIVKALTLVKFHGTVTFVVALSTGEPYWTSVVTFTIPTGVDWNTTNHHPKEHV
jgi:hypothetical protein